ncbi:MAG: GNAT family N-acetyltransferase [Chromatiaceae bacterium]
MNFVCYTDWDQLPPSAGALFEQAERGSIFYARQWFENLTNALDADQPLVLACVVREHQVLAILPLMKAAGDIWHSLKHRYTTHYSFLLAAEDQPRILDCLVRGLNQLLLKALLLEPIADDDSRIVALQRTMERAGYHCERFFRFYNWIYRLQGQCYQDYMAAQPVRLRNTLARKKRKLKREHGYAIRLFSGDQLPRGMVDYHAVYNASWKANEQYAGFLNRVVMDFSRPGWSRLAVLYVQDKPIAAQLWFVLGGKASIFRLSYDHTWRHYSPGSILTSFLMEYVIDTDKVDEIDFLTGNEAYKQDWMSDRRERFALSCVKPATPTGRYARFVESLQRLSNRR